MLVHTKIVNRHAGILMAIQALCFWQVWRWYAARTTDGSDEPWGVVALLAALMLTWPRTARLQLEPNDPLLIAAAVCTVCYALIASLAPPIICAAFAMAAMACSWVSVTGSRPKWPVILALFALSLPVVASLQFYAGYPLRMLTAAGASLLLKPFGLDVERLGTTMLWQGRAVLVDAPCSGVRMLWAGAFLACVLASQRTWVGWRSLAAAMVLMIPVVLIANSVRAAALFVLEIRAEPVPQFLHASVGVATFALAGAAMLGIDAALRNGGRKGSSLDSNHGISGRTEDSRSPRKRRWSAAWRK